MRWFEKIAASRKPDFVIGAKDDPYVLRWWIIPRNRFFNIYLHRFLRSDDDRALHDHPWLNVSIILDGAYTEETIAAGGVHQRRVYEVGAVKFRGPRSAHRIELHAGPCWTLFVTGPRVREWGFHCSHGWRPWQKFVSPKNPGEIGRGCE
jgi:hypothetical protein